MVNPITAFQAVRKPYRGKSLIGWFAGWLHATQQDLEKYNHNFLKVMTTWVVRKYSERRKGGVPTGQLSRFTQPKDKKIEIVEAMMVFIVLTLRRRGLLEADNQPSEKFQELTDAFARCEKIE